MAAIRVWNETLDPGGELGGTLTCVARMASDPAHYVAVSAAHVLAPLVADGVDGPSVDDVVVFDLGDRKLRGKLWYWSELQRVVDGFSNELDAALVTVSEPDARALADALGQPASLGAVGHRSPLAFTGFRSGRSTGAFAGKHSSQPLAYPVLGGSAASVAFTDTLRAELPAQPGDSGSLVVCDPDAVGLLIGAEGDGCRFLPLQPLFEAFDLEWVASPIASAAAPAPLGGVAGDRLKAIDTLARTIWGEARGEPLRGMRAVAAVVVNRATHPHVHWWGRTIVGVCRAEQQFSCWNGDDPNLPKLLSVTQADARFPTCLDVAREAVDGTLPQVCSPGVTHYHTKSSSPSWAAGKVPCDDIGNHLFYNNIE